MTHSLRDPGRVLVVDDEANLRAVVEGLLIREGYAVETVASGDEALQVLGQSPFSTVLTDLRMPGMDGQEVLSRVRQGYPEVSVVVSPSRRTAALFMLSVVVPMATVNTLGTLIRMFSAESAPERGISIWRGSRLR